MRPIDLSLYVIVDSGVLGPLAFEEYTREILAGGATCLQVRMKTRW